MTPFLRALLIAVASLCFSVMGYKLQPRNMLSDELGLIDLEKVIPTSFGSWAAVSEGAQPIVNPQSQELQGRIYAQVLQRVYLSQEFGSIMISVAYGKDQRDTLAVHYPEQCYPSQGFEVQGLGTEAIVTSRGSIRVRKLSTYNGTSRYEPVTYWSMVGSRDVLSGTDKKLAELRYSLRGIIPDGLLFRVSSITRNTGQGFANQSQFIRDLAAALPSTVAVRIIGSGNE